MNLKWLDHNKGHCHSQSTLHNRTPPDSYYSFIAFGAIDRRDVFIRGETCCRHAVSPNGRTDVAYSTRGELLDIGSCAGLHDKLSTGITGCGTQGTALLRFNSSAVGTGLSITIMDSTG